MSKFIWSTRGGVSKFPLINGHFWPRLEGRGSKSFFARLWRGGGLLQLNYIKNNRSLKHIFVKFSTFSKRIVLFGLR